MVEAHVWAVAPYGLNQHLPSESSNRLTNCKSISLYDELLIVLPKNNSPTIRLRKMAHHTQFFFGLSVFSRYM